MSKPDPKPGSSQNPPASIPELHNVDVRKIIKEENLKLKERERILMDNSGSILFNALLRNMLMKVRQIFSLRLSKSVVRWMTGQSPSNTSKTYNDLHRLVLGDRQLEKEYLRLREKHNLLNGNTGLKVVDEIIKHILNKANRSEKQDEMYSERFLTMCLKLAIEVPGGYDVIAKQLNIPSTTIIKQHVSIVNLEPGINNPIFHNLKLILRGCKYELVKNIVLLFGEMSYKIDESSNGDKSTDGLDSVDTVLCFVIHGIFHKYSQPVAFYFLNKTTDCDIRKKCIVEVITALQHIGFKVRATVSNQIKNNMLAILAIQAMINEANSVRISNKENEKESYVVNNIEIVHIYDPPHLLIGIRNNLLKANLHLKNRIAKWEHIVQAYKYNITNDPFTMMPNVTEKHFNLSPKEKMNLKMCTDVFSNEPGWLMYKFMSHISSEAEGTGFLTLYFHKLFGSVIVPVKYGKKCQKYSEITNKKKNYWYSCIDELQEAYFEHLSPTSTSQDRPPCLKGWVVTLKSLIHLYDQLTAEYGRTHKIFPRNLNLNALKRFSSAVRSYDKQNKNRTRENFISYFTQILYDNLTSTNSFCSYCRLKKKNPFWSENDPLFQMIPKNEPK